MPVPVSLNDWLAGGKEDNMLTGKPRKVKQYLFIDRNAEGCGFVKPTEGEEIICIPYQWCSENSYPFIEHRVNGVMTKTINTADVSVIEFEDNVDAHLFPD